MTTDPDDLPPGRRPECTCPPNPDCPVHEVWQMDRASIHRFPVQNAAAQYAPAIEADNSVNPVAELISACHFVLSTRGAGYAARQRQNVDVAALDALEFALKALP